MDVIRVLVQLVTDTRAIACMIVATGTAAYASYRSVLMEGVDPWTGATLVGSGAGGRRRSPWDENVTTIEPATALMFPVVASCSLVLLYFFFGSLAVIVNSLSLISSGVAIGFVILPLVERSLRGAGKAVRRVGCFGDVSLSTFVATCLAILVVLSWLFTGHWLVNDVIGVCLCVLFVCLLRTPSLRIAVILLFGLFLYDIFWVFFSERIFGKNVMVEVASQSAPNPLSLIADKMKLPISPVQTLPLPAKLIFPHPQGGYSILGLGDIVLPSIFLAYTLRLDARSECDDISSGYFARGLVGYAVGLALSFFFNVYFNAAQPALLYLVPGVMAPVVTSSISKKDFGRLWDAQLPSGRVEAEGDSVP
mmetsp:Transcript_13440/g.27424  ORF Transcript_13440/g.27424 Transcript_13440/m.27424 type:complete len:365 (-) Transcript_13440:1145-2239(-)